MGRKKRLNASNVENEESDDSIRIKCERALNSGRRGNYSEAFKLLHEMCLRYETSALVHRTEGSVHAKLVNLVDDSYAKERHRKNAAASGRTAVVLSPNSVEYALFYASTLFQLADGSEKYNEVVVECERALSIQCPSDPAKDNLDVEKEMAVRASTPQDRIRIVQEDLRALLEDAKKAEIACSMNNVEICGCEGASNRSSTTQRQEEPTEVKLDQSLLSTDIKKCPAELEQRRREIQNRVEAAKMSQEIQKSTMPQPQNKEDKAVEYSSGSHMINKRRKNPIMKFSSRVDIVIRPFWDTLTVDKRRDLLKVRICDLRAYFVSTRNTLALNVLSEAITFAGENDTWRYWKCCVCDEKFSHFIMLREHLLNEHSEFPEKLHLVSPETVGSQWASMLESTAGNGTWKPIDTSAAITLMDDQSKQGSSRIGRDTGEDTPQAQKWPLSDDSDRTQVLERIHCLFRLLLKNKCLAKSHLNWVLEYTMGELQLIIPSSQLYGLNQTPHCIHFLGTSQLTRIAEFLQNLSNSCALEANSDELSPGENILQSIRTGTVKERLSLTDDSSCLLLDDRLLNGKLNSSIYDTAYAHDGSTSPPAVDDHEEDILPDNDALLKWIYSLQSIEDHLSVWTQLMEMRKNTGMKQFHLLERMFNVLQILCDIKYEHSSYVKALEAIEVALTEEVKKRETDSVFAPQSYMTFLRKRQAELVRQGNDALAFSSGSQAELDIISNILEKAQAVKATEEYAEDDEQKVGEDLDQEDNYVEVAINRLKDELVIGVEDLVIDARILQNVNHAHQLLQRFEPVSLHDFREVIVALLRSFLQTHLKKLADKAAKEKSDAAIEALLAEIERDANKKSDSLKQKQESPKHRKKKKDHRKVKDSKAKGGGSDQSQFPRQFVHKDDLPQVVCVNDFAVNISGNGDELKTLEDEVTRNNEHEKEERKLIAILEYQRQIEEGAKHEAFSHQGKKVDYGIDVAKMELDRKFSERPDMVLNSGVNEKLSNQELLTGMDELKKKLSGLSLECQEVSGTLRSKRQKSRSRSQIKKGLLHRGIVGNSSVKSCNKSFDTLSSEKDKGDTGSLQREGYAKDPVLDQDDAHSGNKAIEVQRDLCLAKEQKETEKVPLQEDSKVDENIEQYVIGIGLQNDVGEYNCFLNVIIQSLWHLRDFRDEFLSRSTSLHVHIGDPCVVCALYDILTALNTASSDVQIEAISPTSLRASLSNLCADSNFFQESQMNDASEVLAVIFDCLHQSFTIGSAVSNCELEDSKCKGSCVCTKNTCIAHTLFGMDIYQKMECSSCGIHSRHQKYTTFFHNINASTLRSVKTTHANSIFEELLKLVEMEDRLACDPEAGGCGALNHIHHFLSTPPHVFTIGTLEEVF